MVCIRLGGRNLRRMLRFKMPDGYALAGWMKRLTAGDPKHSGGTASTTAPYCCTSFRYDAQDGYSVTFST